LIHRATMAQPLPPGNKHDQRAVPGVTLAGGDRLWS
jgi:hypothetical protein